MSDHTHPDPSVLTFGCDACIAAVKVGAPRRRDGLSADAARTLRNNEMIDTGRHPATGQPLRRDHYCGECAHHHAYRWSSKVFHKCELHRLGESHSASSDIRVSWPACARFVLEEAT